MNKKYLVWVNCSLTYSDFMEWVDNAISKEEKSGATFINLHFVHSLNKVDKHESETPDFAAALIFEKRHSDE